MNHKRKKPRSQPHSIMSSDNRWNTGGDRQKLKREAEVEINDGFLVIRPQKEHKDDSDLSESDISTEHLF